MSRNPRADTKAGCDPCRMVRIGFGIVFFLFAPSVLVSCDEGGRRETDASGPGGSDSGTFDAAVGVRDASIDPGFQDASTDPYEAERQRCIDEINKLRATKGLPPYERWREEEPCADKQVAYDQEHNSPHEAWKSGVFGCSAARNQNECMGAGAVSCVDMCWSESRAPACANCDNCPGDHGCDGCDFYGTETGTVCGHYENLSAKGFTKAACGFSPNGWIAINFR